MSTNDASDFANGLPKSAIQSVSSGGESVSLDTNKLDAQERTAQNQDLTNIVNRQVRPYFSRVKIRWPYG